MLPGDIDLSGSNSTGAQHFKNYLEYARKGEQALARNDQVTDTLDFDSQFEEAVYDALEAEGHDVVSQVDSSGYSIDLAIKHPKQPGKFILGIECDGAAYHSSKTARDRDRTRQMVLENLGWTIHRIWSPDWASNKGGELEKIASKVEQLIDESPSTDGGFSKVDVEVQETEVVAIPEQERDGIQRHLSDWEPITVRQQGDQSFDDVWESQIQGVLTSIAKRYGPVSKERAFRATISRWHISRLGKNIRESLDTTTRKLHSQGKIKLQNGFLWPGDRPETLPIRTNTNQAERSIEEIPLEELAKAAHLILKAGGRMTRADLILEIARLIGYQRQGENITNRIDSAVELLVSRNCVTTDSNGMMESVDVDVNQMLLKRVYE
jgi:very-short-patch-repair endonuclease